jgi:translation initiation factor 2D
MVTLISNFEIWDLFRADDLAEELKHKAASSSAVQPLVGSSPKRPLYEIMVQGTSHPISQGEKTDEWNRIA